MSGWQKLIRSGSNAELNTVTASFFKGDGSAVTGVISASFAISASWAPGSGQANTASYALTASYLAGQYNFIYSASLDVTWSVSHNLNQQRPLVTVWNLANEVVIPEKIYSPSVNQTNIYFPTSQSGFASFTLGTIAPGSESDPIFVSKSGSFATTGSNTFVGTEIVSGSVTITGSLSVIGTISGSHSGNGAGLTGVVSSSYSVTSSYASTASYSFPFGPNQSVQFNDNGLISGSARFVFDKVNRILYLSDALTSTAITASGTVNNYLQINIQNLSVGSTASADIVATNDTGTELGNYIDMGINGSAYALPALLGSANDGYLYATGSKLLIGNLTPSTHVSSSIWFVVGGGDASTNTRMVISSSGQVGIGVIKPRYALEVSGTISSSNYIGTFSGSLQGNGSQITNVPSASFAATSSFSTAIFSRGASVADVTNGISTTGSYYVWRCPFTCQVQSLYGKKSGTGTSQVNARKSGSGGYSYHTASNLLLPTADQWATANSIQNANYAAGDSLEIIITGSGATQIAVQLDFIRI